jgi:spore maturation protein CgeB
VRFLILTADYPAFLCWFYTQHRGLEVRPYAEQLRMRRESLYNEAFFFSDNLKKLGHEAHDIYVNNASMQKIWAREHGFRFREDWRWEFRLRRGIVPWLSRSKEPWLFRSKEPWLYDILAAQIRYYKPDVLFNQAMNTLSSRFLQEIKPHVELLMGQHASPLPEREDFSCYDLFISSLPDLVEYFRKRGIPAEFHRLGFGPECLSRRDGAERPFDITFIGNFYSIHSSRVALLEALCSRFPQVKVWTPDVDHLAPGSSIRNCYQGQAWGREMYTIFSRSKITLNNHGDFALYANNCRLYEATGMGALLMTDWKENLHEMFEPGKEVVAYQSADECVELIQYYLDHKNEREAIARAGHEHTMREHTYYQRSKELVDIVGRYL